MRWLFIMVLQWLFFLVPEWLIQPGPNNACKCYCFHRQWGFPYSVVLCGNLTIPNYEKYFHCFLIVNKVKLRHSPGRPSRSDFVQSLRKESKMVQTKKQHCAFR